MDMIIGFANASKVVTDRASCTGRVNLGTRNQELLLYIGVPRAVDL